MRLGVRARLFLFSLAAILLAIATGGLYLRNVLRSQLEANIEDELLHYAQSAREMLVSLSRGHDRGARSSGRSHRPRHVGEGDDHRP